jgi:hypothetical protein
MKRISLPIGVVLITAYLASAAAAATLEVPANGGDASGIGYFSGWKCPPNDDITLVLDGGAPIPVPSRGRRLDTAGTCGNDGRNGFISQYNFSLLGDGLHTASVRQNGVQFAQATFNVTTFGTTFLGGASGTYVLAGFPQAGQTTTIEWVQGAQNFVIVDTSGGGGSAEVRFFNDLNCNGFDFTSTLSANGFVWTSFTGFFSPYQTVNRTSLGPFTQTSSTLCGDITYPFTLPVTPGRRHVLFQEFVSGGPFLLIEDEGPVGEPLGEGAAPAADPGTAGPTVTVPGVVAEGTGVFSAR